MHIDRRARLLADGRRGEPVVEVAVGQEDGLARQLVGFKVIEDRVGFVAGVDNGAFERLFICDNIAFVSICQTTRVLICSIFSLEHIE
jgi:hypothetical protein